jgi:hypothetical protein
MFSWLVTVSTHSQSYSYLEKLTAKMAEAGYRPVTEVALYDVEEEEKEHMVKVHSEKLDIAFGLLSTEPRTDQDHQEPKGLPGLPRCHQVYIYGDRG